jgi:methyltransferase
MLSQQLFFVLVVVVAVQRSAELRLSRRNEARLRALGAREHARGHFVIMQLLHGAWFVSTLLEVKLLHPPLHRGLAVAALLVFAAGQTLRASARRALAERWSVRVLTVPGAPPVTHGIYRYLRHPNYLGVVLELAALPLVHSAWRTALVFSIANALLLRVRVSAEERALTASGGYRESFADLHRFVPRLRVGAQRER